MNRPSLRINPLWKTYFFIASMSVLFTAAATFVDYQRIEESARNELKYSNALVTHSIHNLLDKQELLLDALGKKLVKAGIMNKAKSSTLLDAMLKSNPELAGLGLALPSGQLIVTSSNFSSGKLPNLLDKEDTRKSFKAARHSDEMVMGRTYYMTSLKQWLIPLRKRILDADGRVVAVMTSGVKLSFLKKMLADQSSVPGADVTLISDEYYRYYVSYADESDYDYLFKMPVSEQIIQHFTEGMIDQVGYNFIKGEGSGKPVVLQTKNYQGEKVITSLSYNDKYHFFSATSLNKTLVLNKLCQRLAWYISLLLLFNLTLYFLFRMNISSQGRSKKALEFQATHDQLTKLPNRRYLLESFDAWKQKHPKGFAIFFIDLDNFKGINDLYGHSIGDQVLLEVSARVTANFDDCLCIRQGGDEFIVLTRSGDNVHNLNLCRHFLTQLNKAFVLDGLEFSIQASIGVVKHSKDGDKLDELLSKADMAMYEAKRLRCGFFSYSEGLQEKMQRTAMIEKELLHAVEREELFVVYQPQVDAYSKEIIGVEALLRWDNPSLGLVPPDEFIMIAESIGLIHEIGLFVFETALAEFISVCRSVQKNKKKLRLSINVSVQQLFHPAFLMSIFQLQRRHDCSSIELMIEVTESLFIEDVGQAKKILLALKEKNILTSLDDFGTGYSSLGVLSGLPISELKIDKVFVENILNNNQDLQLIKSIIKLGSGLGMSVIAEGVEEVEQVDVLSENGCDLFQGYYFSKPLNKKDLIVFMSK